MQGAGCRVQRAPTALMAKTKACLEAQPPFKLHFLLLSWCGACQAPLGRLGNVSIIASKCAGIAGGGRGGGDKRIVKHVQVCVSACLYVCVSVFTVNRNSCRATHTGLNRLHLSNGRDYKCNRSCKCRPLL